MAQNPPLPPFAKGGDGGISGEYFLQRLGSVAAWAPLGLYAGP
jgi:hypothetical protein